MTCVRCRQRKGRRSCPALGAHICSLCCGRERRVEIACPADCAYLGGGHASGWDGRRTERERDERRIAPHLAPLSEPQQQLFVMTLVGLGAIRQRQREMDDALFAQAVAALRKTVETRARGVLYEHQADDIRAQGILVELRALYEARDDQGRVTAPADADLLAVLRGLQGALDETTREGAGPSAFLDTAARLVAELASAAPAQDAVEEPRILLA